MVFLVWNIRLKRLLLFFWAMWFSLVTVGNVADALKQLDVLPADAAFASGNYALILDVLAPFHLPAIVAAGLFAGVIAWESVGTLLFWWTALSFRGYQQAAGRRRLLAAFMASLGLWGAFQIACEAFPSQLSYRLAGTHRVLFVETLATLLVIVLIPEEPVTSPPGSGAATR